MKRTLIFLLFLVLFTPLHAFEEIEEVLTYKLSEESLTVRPAETLKVTAEIAIRKPWHINSMHPLDDGFISTEFSIDHEFASIKNIKAPEHRVVTLSFSPEPMALYEGSLKFEIEIELVPSASGTFDLPVTFTYQACNNSVCLPPEEVTRNILVEISGDPASVKPAGGGGTIADWIQGKGLFLTLLLIFLSGLALNLTPCVYPMIPITIGFFTAQAKERSGNVWPLAFLYFLGITITYSILGLVAALTGGLFGNLLQNPVILVSVGIVLVLLSLSMFEVYKLQLPVSITSRLSGKKGLIGAFLMGALVGLVAAPCIGPIVLGLLTYVASTGNPGLGFIMFFSLSAGLGLPYLILGVFSGSMKKLPHSGTWMATVERIFGFLLLAAAVYIVRSLLPGSIDILLFSLLALACGIVLIFFMPGAGESSSWRIFRRILGVLSLALAVFLALPLATESRDHGDEIWKPYSRDALEQAAIDGIPVVIDFYADWCLPCKELDEKTFSRSEVRKKLESFSALKADLTKSSSPEVKALMNEYSIKGVPTIVIIGRDGRERKDLTFVGFTAADRFLSKLDAALN